MTQLPVAELYPQHAPTRVERPVTVHRWEHLSFVHMRYPASDVQRLLPDGVTVDTFDGDAWVGLVPFRLRIRARWTPFVPWVSTFPEINVRTYVRGPDGTPGIWFLSLDAARLGAVIVARSTYSLPYTWARMRLVDTGTVVTYSCRRRWPGPPASTSIVVEVREPLDVAGRDPLVCFLTARWNFFCRRRSGLAVGPAEHAPWPLHRARLLHLDDGLIGAVGLGQAIGYPVVHYSPAVEARLGPLTGVPRGPRGGAVNL